MSLYPSLEDMKVDHMAAIQTQLAYANPAPPSAISNGSNNGLYPGLGEYMGMELSLDVIAQNMPEYLQIAQNIQPNTHAGIIAPLSSTSVTLPKAFVTQSVKQLLLCKDKDGKIGLKLRDVNGGLFVCLVIKGSPAAMAGLRFGDQILEINNSAVAGMSAEKGHSLMKDAPVNGIKISVRDRNLSDAHPDLHHSPPPPDPLLAAVVRETSPPWSPGLSRLLSSQLRTTSSPRSRSRSPQPGPSHRVPPPLPFIF